jgi:hypothetical protein
MVDIRQAFITIRAHVIVFVLIFQVTLPAGIPSHFFVLLLYKIG